MENMDLSTISDPMIDASFMADGAPPKDDKTPDLTMPLGPLKKGLPPSPKKGQENELSEDLKPYQEQMQTWIANHMDDVSAFLNNRGIKYKIICGDGFYHQPKNDIICLSVPFFKEHLEKGTMTIDQIFFGTLHEIAHLKTMWEQDVTGKMNQMEQFNYERSKKIRDSKDHSRYANLGSTYRFYYNVLEDAIVNRMVLNTRHFGQTANPETFAQIKQLYTDKFFAVYQKSPGGAYKKNEKPDQKDGKTPGEASTKDKKKDPDFIFVGEGKGDYRIMDKSDYEKGFDWTTAEPDMSNSSQFMTYFIKNQMIDLKKEDIITRENPDGKFKLSEMAATALTKPLVEVFPILLQGIDDKYKNDPERRKTYLRFLAMKIAVQTYKPEGRKFSKAGVDVYSNVTRSENIRGDYLDVRNAGIDYKHTVEKALLSMGLSERGTKTITYLDLFNRFKDLDQRVTSSWTFPLKHNLNKRTKIMRQVLEPIFSMLCVLDDSFDVELPDPAPSQNEGEGEGGEGESPEPENPERPEWGVGDKVIHTNPDGEPILEDGKLKKGQVIDRTYDSYGNISSVEVEWFEPSEIVEMATGSQSSKPKDILSGRTENITQPYKYLRLWQDEDEDSASKQKQNDPRKLFKQKKEKKEKKEKPEKQEGEDDDDSDKDQEKGDEDTDADSQENEGSDESLDDMMSTLEKNYRDAIEKDIQKANDAEAKEQRESREYQEKVGKDTEYKSLLKALKEARERQGLPEPPANQPELQSEEIIKKFQEIQELIAPYSEQMAKAWLEITRNITNMIEVVKDKYYRAGSPDVKKMQKFLPELEIGADIDMRLIYERIVEKIRVELKPKMLRLVLMIDNSGSMGWALGSGGMRKVEQVRVAIALLNSSLRSLRNLFKEQMKEVLGTDNPGLDLICDVEIHTFGSYGNHRVIKDFDVKDLDFIEDESKQKPRINVGQETINTLLAFQQLSVDESTYDEDAWKDFVASRVQDPKLVELLQKKMITEVLFQISDGSIEGNCPTDQIKLAKSLGIACAGFAIGGQEAVTALEKRHDVVICADSAEEIVSEFAELLVKTVKDRVEKPMEELLKHLEKD